MTMSNIDKSPSGNHPCDYMQRARARLDEGTNQALLYAAFELRAGIESRLRQYLIVQPNISKKASIKRLGKTLKRAFSTGDKVIELRFYRGATEKNTALVGTFYYTPVTSSFRKKAEKLGGHLHGMSETHKEPWWAQTRQFLEDTYAGLVHANLGNLMGPPIIDTETRTAEVRIDLHDNYKLRPARWIDKAKVGEKHLLTVKYLDRHPLAF